MRSDASGNLLVGTTSNSVYNDASGTGIALNAGEIQIAGTGTPLYANRQGSNGDIIDFRKDGASVGVIGVVNNDRMVFATADGLGLQFDKDNNRIIPCDNDGAYNNNVELGDEDLAFTNLFLTGGIQFDSRSNKLNDYEEGTWTPALVGSTGAGSGITYSLRVAKYTKIGDIVHCQCDIYITAITSIPTGQVRISGLPFGAATSDSMSGNWYALGEPNIEGLASSLNSDSTQALLSAGQSYFVLWRDNKATTGMSPINWTTNFDTSGRFRFIFQYFTDS